MAGSGSTWRTTRQHHRDRLIDGSEEEEEGTIRKKDRDDPEGGEGGHTKVKYPSDLRRFRPPPRVGLEPSNAGFLQKKQMNGRKSGRKEEKGRKKESGRRGGTAGRKDDGRKEGRSRMMEDDVVAHPPPNWRVLEGKKEEVEEKKGQKRSGRKKEE